MSIKQQHQLTFQMFVTDNKLTRQYRAAKR